MFNFQTRIDIDAGLFYTTREGSRELARRPDENKFRYKISNLWASKNGRMIQSFKLNFGSGFENDG
jgi:hypothetical protein